jgi:beta-carotene ketolase (CrtW type)
MGIVIGITVILLWSSHLIFSLAFLPVDFSSGTFYLHVLLQAYLYTGLFITAHDSMHGTVSRNKFFNDGIGKISTFLFAALSYRKLLVNHKLHHDFPGTEKDPDFCVKSQNFFIWWINFLFRYASFAQIIIMGLIFNLLKIWFEEINIWFFLVIPSLIGSLQLFYFGTYIPHKIPHSPKMKPYNARTQRKNHFWAMLSCYFFGYHYEHHEHPSLPWWKLYKAKT